jgi:hypothetical protein
MIINFVIGGTKNTRSKSIKGNHFSGLHMQFTLLFAACLVSALPAFDETTAPGVKTTEQDRFTNHGNQLSDSAASSAADAEPQVFDSRAFNQNDFENSALTDDQALDFEESRTLSQSDSTDSDIPKPSFFDKEIQTLASTQDIQTRDKPSVKSNRILDPMGRPPLPPNARKEILEIQARKAYTKAVRDASKKRSSKGRRDANDITASPWVPFDDESESDEEHPWFPSDDGSESYEEHPWFPSDNESNKDSNAHYYEEFLA